MRETLVALLIFLCLVSASLGSLFMYLKFPTRYREEDTHNVLKLIANIFGVMTSLVLGLMINSSKNTFKSVDRNIHVFATNLIVLDRTLVQYGPDASETRQRLLAYAERAARYTRHDDPLIADRISERLLNDTGASLKAIRPQNAEQIALWQHAQQQFQRVVELRWIIVEQSDGTIPTPILVLLVAWLMLIFASFGYRAPQNFVVVSVLVLSSLMVASAIYLILDMDVPFAGPIQVSPAPLERAIAEMQTNT